MESDRIGPPGPGSAAPPNRSRPGRQRGPRRVQGGTDDRPQTDGGRTRGAARAHLGAQRGDPPDHASLDLETVLNAVVESARAGARFGAIATIDEPGAPQDFVTSGFTEAEPGLDLQRALRRLPPGPARRPGRAQTSGNRVPPRRAAGLSRAADTASIELSSPNQYYRRIRWAAMASADSARAVER